MYVNFQLVLIFYPNLFLVKVQLCAFLLGKYSMFLMSSSFSWSRAVFFRVFLVKSQVVQFRSKSQFAHLGQVPALAPQCGECCDRRGMEELGCGVEPAKMRLLTKGTSWF